MCQDTEAEYPYFVPADSTDHPREFYEDGDVAAFDRVSTLVPGIRARFEQIDYPAAGMSRALHVVLDDYEDSFHLLLEAVVGTGRAEGMLRSNPSLSDLCRFAAGALSQRTSR
jgi:hypothetical protein